MTPEQLLAIIQAATAAEVARTGLRLRYGFVSSTYAGTDPPSVKWDGEDADSTRTYSRLLSGYPTPAADDRVVALYDGTTYLILGSVG